MVSITVSQKQTFLFIASIFLLVFVTKMANAGPVPVFDLPSILSKTDLVADVQPIQSPGQYRLLAVLAGNKLMPGSIIKITTQNPDLLSASKNRERVCVFLMRSSGNPSTYALSNPYYSLFHIGAKIVSPKMPERDAIEAQLIADLSDTHQTVANDAVVWLNYLDSAEGKQEIARLSKTAHPPTPVYAAYLAEQVPNGQRQVIQQSLDFLDTHKNDPALADWLWKIEYAFSSIRSTNDVAFLNHTLVQTDGLTSRWLASSSRYWADKSSVSYLMQALTQFNTERLRISVGNQDALAEATEKEYSCISALSTITKRPSPGFEIFGDTPNKSYDDWQQWWKSVGHIKYGQINTPGQ